MYFQSGYPMKKGVMTSQHRDLAVKPVQPYKKLCSSIHASTEPQGLAVCEFLQRAGVQVTLLGGQISQPAAQLLCESRKHTQLS